MTYTVVLLHEQDGRYSAVVPAIECASCGDTVPEALRHVEEAIRCHLASLKKHGKPAPDDTDVFEVDMGDATDAVIYKVTVGDPEAVAVA
jgi:predicted RNase H-like HicB family nuclease